MVMHIDTVPNRGSRPAYLLRESYREGARVRKRTLANLSSLSDEQIQAMRAVLRGEPVTVRGRVRPIELLFNLEHPDTLSMVTEMDTSDVATTSMAEESRLFSGLNRVMSPAGAGIAAGGQAL